MERGARPQRCSRLAARGAALTFLEPTRRVKTPLRLLYGAPIELASFRQ